MKTNNTKKIVVSVLALAMGAGLAGSISGSVAWYQYSTKTSALIAGTTAGTSRNLQISSDDGANWSQHLDLGATNFRPASVYGAAGSLHFVDHPVYKNAVLPAAADQEGANGVYKKEFNLVFKCEDTTSTGLAQVAKEVYLTKLNIIDVNGTGETEQSHKDITPAVRIEIDGTNDFLVSATAGTTTTNGNLNLNGNKDNNQNPILDKDGYDANDETGNLITYLNYERTGEDPENYGLSYTTVDSSSVLVNDSNAYSFTNKAGRLLTTTAASGNSAVVKITVWIEGWQTLDGTSVWDSAWLAQNFQIQLQFSCEADR